MEGVTPPSRKQNFAAVHIAFHLTCQGPECVMWLHLASREPGKCHWSFGHVATPSNIRIQLTGKKENDTNV